MKNEHVFAHTNYLCFYRSYLSQEYAKDKLTIKIIFTILLLKCVNLKVNKILKKMSV